MRVVSAALVLVVALGASGVAAASDDTETITKTAKIEPGGTLRLKNFSGRVTITAEDRADIAIQAVRRATRERLDHIKLDVHNDGPDVVVDANHRDTSWSDWWGWGRNNNVVETDFDVKVPRKTNLDVNVFSSPVTVTGVEGDERLHGFSSRLRLDDVVGPVQAHTFSGAVEIHERAWQPRQTIDVDTFSGSVDLHVPENAKAAVTFRSFSGHLDSAMPLTFTSLGGRHGQMNGRLGTEDSEAGTMRVKTFSGSFHIGR